MGTALSPLLLLAVAHIILDINFKQPILIDHTYMIDQLPPND
jgi:hypothetical protein